MGGLPTNWQLAHIFFRHIILFVFMRKNDKLKSNAHIEFSSLQLAVATYANSTVTAKPIK